MDDINRFIMNLSWGSSQEDKNNSIEKLLLIEDKDMHLLLRPLDKEVWEGAAEVITRLGYPRIKVILPGLLEWLQDMNWPGAQQIAQFLGQIGEPIVPYVKAVLKDHQDDEVWIYWLFEYFIDHWDREKITQIQAELIEITNGRINDLRALSTLFKHNLIDYEEANRQLTKKLHGAIDELADLEEKYIEVDCGDLERGFKEVLFKPELVRKYTEDNKELFTYCGLKSILQEYMREIEALAKEITKS